MQVKSYILILFTLSLLACNKEQSATVQDELKPYYDLFLIEAETRNVFLSEDELNVSLELRTLEGSVGQCQHFSDSPDVAIIDLSAWEMADDLKREFLIFHELGHCILGRGHTDLKDETGACLSIMHSDNTVCTMIYSESTRSGYLDELFNN